MAKVTIVLQDVYHDPVTGLDGVDVFIRGLDQKETTAIRLTREIERLLNCLGVTVKGTGATLKSWR